ncbi:hypothetical protein Mapa_012998 [Marchantia paleacea]|nr:hypothetical protein Mapa_012998 [Marchantia paleacea]
MESITNFLLPLGGKIWDSAPLLTAVVVLFVSFLISGLLLDRANRKLPPGPWSWPIVGAFWSFYHSRPVHQVFPDLSKVYGPMFHLRFGSSHIICVSGQSLAVEVPKTQDQIFSSRLLTGFGKHFNNYQDMAFSPAGANHTSLRKVSTTFSSNAKVESFACIREADIINLLSTIFRVRPSRAGYITKGVLRV